ncbi:MAG: DUF2029 domain-containing protein, partial [Deltaproteobacteria bacterium]|nr:DUF2029 domain-containing protein [Deltaproteobacteria bacterium]
MHNHAILGLGGILVVVGALIAGHGHASPAAVLMASVISGVGYMLGAWALHKMERLTRACFAWLFAVSLAARTTLLVSPPVLEDDLYRYLWDGAVLRAGESPYRFSPQEVMDRRLGRPVPQGMGDEELASLERLAALSRTLQLEPTFLRINYPSVPTIYPPISQGVFALASFLALGSVRAWKLVVVGIDLAVIGLTWALLGFTGQPRKWILLYAWSPLVLLSFAGSAHVDILAVALLLIAVLLALRHQPTWAGAALGMATAAKIFPLLAWPALRRRLGIKGTLVAIATVVGSTLPFLGKGRVFDGLFAYASTWTVNSAGFALVSFALPESLARATCGLLALAVTFHAARLTHAPADVVRAATAALAALVLLSPAVNPWYVAWLVPFLAVTRSPMLLALTVTVLSYHAHFLPG